MKILFLTRYNVSGASSRYRSYNYLPYFVENELDCSFKPLLGKNYVENLYQKKTLKVFFQKVLGPINRVFFLLFKLKDFDLIIIEKELLPNIPYFVEAFLLKGKIYSLDFDDYIAKDYKENRLKSLFLKNKIQRLVEKAKFVTVGNHWYYKVFNSNNLKYLPTVINFDDYTKVAKYDQVDIITLVWIGTPSTVKYLQIIVPALQMLSKKYSIKLKVIGADISIGGVDVELVSWNSKTEVQELLSSDIGIMPLKRTMWENGKCGFKLIQYMACGLPVVATIAPANNEIIEDGINGFIITDETEWYCKLEKLIVNQQLREKFGKSGRNRIKLNYSYQIWGKQYVNFIKNG